MRRQATRLGDDDLTTFAPSALPDDAPEVDDAPAYVDRPSCTCHAGIQFYMGAAGCPVCGAAKAIPPGQGFGAVARIVKR
jgi:hypothetical protein